MKALPLSNSIATMSSSRIVAEEPTIFKEAKGSDSSGKIGSVFFCRFLWWYERAEESPPIGLEEAEMGPKREK